MTATSFTGVIPPILTPYSEAGEIDILSLERLVESLIDHGVHGLFVLGSSGEAAFLTDAQRRELLVETVRITAGRVPVIAGVNDMTTNRVIDHVRIAADAGAEAIVATAPFYALPNATEVDAHFRAIAESTSLPLFAYDVPVRVHHKLEAELLVRLGLDRVIVGVKDSSGDDVAFRRLVAANRAAGSPLTLFTGHEVVADGALLAGADGVVPGLGNVDPAGYVRMFHAAKAGDWKLVQHEQERLAGLFEIVTQSEHLGGEAAGLGAFKTALVQLGVFDSNIMSRPITRLSGDAVDRIRELVAGAGLLER
ncbi:MAG: dihydrodipicolinate synthase family protein [Protaetiibacter sp.]